MKSIKVASLKGKARSVIYWEHVYHKSQEI